MEKIAAVTFPMGKQMTIGGISFKPCRITRATLFCGIRLYERTVMNKKTIFTLLAAAVFAFVSTGCNSTVVEENIPDGIAAEESHAPDIIKAYVVEAYPGVKIVHFQKSAQNFAGIPTNSEYSVTLENGVHIVFKNPEQAVDQTEHAENAEQ